MSSLPKKELLTPESASVWICIDSFDDHELHGSFFSCFEPEPITFSGSGTLLIALEELYDSLKTPHSSFEKREFSKRTSKKQDFPKEKTAPNFQSRFYEAATIQNHCGKAATFEVTIFFRQHASWQGRVFWKEGKQEVFFRSALELLHLLYSAMETPPPN